MVTGGEGEEGGDSGLKAGGGEECRGEGWWGGGMRWNAEHSSPPSLPLPLLSITETLGQSGHAEKVPPV